MGTTTTTAKTKAQDQFTSFEIASSCNKNDNGGYLAFNAIATQQLFPSCVRFWYSCVQTIIR